MTTFLLAAANAGRRAAASAMAVGRMMGGQWGGSRNLAHQMAPHASERKATPLDEVGNLRRGQLLPAKFIRRKQHEYDAVAVLTMPVC